MAVGKNEFGSYPLAFIKNLINKKYLFNFKRHGMKKNYNGCFGSVAVGGMQH